MALEAPLLGFASVVAEELGQHLGAGANSEELRVRPELGEVVWCRCRRRAELERRAREGFEQDTKGLGIVVFDDARLVQHDGAECAGVESVQAVVVGHVDAVLYVVGVTAYRHDHAHVAPFGGGLLGHSQRREDEHLAGGVAPHGVRPRKLHAGLAEAGVGKDGAAPAPQRPPHDVVLEGKQRLVRLDLARDARRWVACELS